MSNLSNAKWNATEEKAIKLLGSGCTPSQVATAIGVTESRISQLLATEEFAHAVASLRYEALAKHNETDAAYDSIEDALIEKLADVLPLMMRPMEILKAIQVINGAKRRGQSTPDQIINQQTVVNLTMPTQIINKFSMNSNNQITNVGTQTLETIQSTSLLNQTKEKAKALALSSGAPKDVIQSTTIRD